MLQWNNEAKECVQTLGSNASLCAVLETIVHFQPLLKACLFSEQFENRRTYSWLYEEETVAKPGLWKLPFVFHSVNGFLFSSLFCVLLFPQLAKKIIIMCCSPKLLANSLNISLHIFFLWPCLCGSQSCGTDHCRPCLAPKPYQFQATWGSLGYCLGARMG